VSKAVPKPRAQRNLTDPDPRIMKSPTAPFTSATTARQWSTMRSR